MSEEAGPSNESDFTLHKCEIIRGQSRSIIYNVYNFLKKNFHHRRTVKPLIFLKLRNLL